MKKKIEIDIKWLILISAIILFIVLVSLLCKEQLNLLDDMVYDAIKKYINPTTTKYVKLITKLCNVFTIVIVIILIVIFQRKYGILIVLNVVSTELINVIFKIIFSRSRPSILTLIEEGGYSFPSGHAMASISLYGFLFYLAYKKIKKNSTRFITCLALLLIIILVGLSRIYLGVHYASDILAGYLLAVAWLIIFIFISDRYIGYGEKK